MALGPLFAGVQQTACLLTLAAYGGACCRCAVGLGGLDGTYACLVIYIAIRPSLRPKTRERVEVPEWVAFLANRRLCFKPGRLPCRLYCQIDPEKVPTSRPRLSSTYLSPHPVERSSRGVI